MTKKNKTSLSEDFLAFKNSIKTLQLSTITSDGKPNASYSPFVTDAKGNFYIFVSQLASHTQDLLENPVASILLIQDEATTKQLFARQRISYQCDVSVIAQDNKNYQALLESMESCFGNIIELLQTLPDFILFQLSPYQGQYVKGFGKAYKLMGDDLQVLQAL